MTTDYIPTVRRTFHEMCNHACRGLIPSFGEYMRVKGLCIIYDQSLTYSNTTHEFLRCIACRAEKGFLIYKESDVEVDRVYRQRIYNDHFCSKRCQFLQKNLASEHKSAFCTHFCEMLACNPTTGGQCRRSRACHATEGSRRPQPRKDAPNG